MHFNNSTQTLTPVEESSAAAGETKSFRLLSVRNLKVGAWCGLLLLVIALSISGVWFFTLRSSDPPGSLAERRLVSQMQTPIIPTYQPQNTIPVGYKQLDLFDIKDHIEETKETNSKRFEAAELKIQILTERLNLLEGEVVRLKSQRFAGDRSVKMLNNTTKVNNTDDQIDLDMLRNESSSNKSINTQSNLKTRLSLLNETITQFQEKVGNYSKAVEREFKQQMTDLKFALKAMENATNDKIVNLRNENVTLNRLALAALRVMINKSCQMQIDSKLPIVINQSIGLLKSNLLKELTNISKNTQGNSSLNIQGGINLQQILSLEKQIDMMRTNLKTHNQCCTAISRRNSTESNIKTFAKKYKSLAAKFSQFQYDITSKLSVMQDLIADFDHKTTKDLRTEIETLIQSKNSTNLLKLEKNSDLAQCQCNITNQLQELRARSKTYVETMMGIEKTDRIRGDLSLRNSLNARQFNQFNRRLNVVETRLKNARTLIGDNSNSTVEFNRLLQGKLDAGWMQAPNGRAYVVLRNVGSWYEAADSCVKAKGHLAYEGMRNAAMRGFIQSNLVHTAGGTGAWIGLRRQLRNTPWFWLDGQVLVRNKSNWSANQPNYYTEGRACALTTSGFGKWNDLGCSAQIRGAHALCERLSQPADV